MTISGSSVRFFVALSILGGSYAVLILAMLAGDIFFAADSDEPFWSTFFTPDFQYALRLTLVTCLVTTVLSLWVDVPLGYLISRTRFWGRPIIEAIVDIPIVLPPLVIGISLLILFQTAPGKALEHVTSRHTGFLLTYVVIPLMLSIAIWPLLRQLPRRRDARGCTSRRLPCCWSRYA